MYRSGKNSDLASSEKSIKNVDESLFHILDINSETGYIPQIRQLWKIEIQKEKKQHQMYDD